MANMNFIRVLISIRANKSWPLWQLDVMNTFFYGDLHELYMMLHLGFKILGSEGKVSRLIKALYGLK